MNQVQEFRHIFVIEDRKGRRIISLEESNYTIGRDSNNPIVIYDYQVSRTHASLIRQTEEETQGEFSYQIIDGDLKGNRSTNGLSINGKSYSTHDLKHGDTILFANEAKASYYIISTDSGIDLFNPEGLEKISASRVTLNSQSTDTLITKADEDKNTEEQQELIRLASFPELSPNPIIELDWDGNLTYVNPAASLKFDTIYEDKLKHPILIGLLSEDSNRQGNLFLREIKIGTEIFEQYVHYLSERKVIRSYIFDFTKRKQVEAQLREAQARYQAIIRQTSEGIFLAYASNRRIIEANETLLEILGYSQSQVTSLSVYNVLASDLTSINHDLNRVLETKEDYVGKYLFRCSDASLINLETSISLTSYQNKDIFCFVVRNVQIYEQQDFKDYLMYHDQETNLPNQKLFQEQLEIAIAKAQNFHYLMGLIAIEIDNLQHFNQSEELKNNQELIQNIKQIIQSCLQKENLLARWTNNQFMILFTRITGPKDTAKVAKKIFATLTPYLERQSKQSQVELKTHMAVFIYPIDAENSSLLIKSSLYSLEQSKAGNNHHKYGVTGFSLTPKTASLLKLETLISNAFREQQFFLCYQPQIDSSTRGFTGLEALLRWNHPELGKVTPKHFLRLTEESDFMLPLGIWILQTATLQMQKWFQDQNNYFPIGINISTRQFSQPNFVASVNKILEQTGLPPELLELEFTETCFAKNTDMAYKTLEQLSALKVKLCLDSFGSGNCALTHLQKVAFDTVKISPNITGKVDIDPKIQTLVSSIATLCEGYNIRLIAVGVEKVEQMDILRRLGCTQIQGNLFSRPLASKEMSIFLQKSNNQTFD